jgi:signal transduction histidine kinase
LSTQKDDSNKVKTFIAITKADYYLNLREGIVYAQQGLTLAEKINWKAGIANLHNNLGLMVGDTGNNKAAIEHFEKSYALNTEMNSKPNLINNLNNLGRTYRRQSDFSKAADYYFKALTIAEEINGHEQIALVTDNIASNYYSQRDLAKANEYEAISLKHAELANVPRLIGTALMNLGTFKSETKDTVNAKLYYARALAIFQQTGNQVKIAEALSNMVPLEKDYKKAIERNLQAQAIYNTTGRSSAASIENIYNLGAAYFEFAQRKPPIVEKDEYLQHAETTLLEAKALAEQTKNAQVLSHVLLVLTDLESGKGLYKPALDYYKQHNVIEDSLYSQDKKNEIAGIEGKHNMAVKDNEIAIAKLTLLNQRKTQFGLIAGLALLGIIGGLFFWQSRNRKKTNTTLMVLNNQLDEANKVKARFFGILSHDLRSPIVNPVHFLHLQKDSPDLLSEKTQATYRQNITSSAEDLLNTMEAMLLWSKAQMENFKPNIKSIAVSDLFIYLQKFAGQTAAVKITFQQADGLQVSGDENYLRTIMQNLTANAIKALKNTPGASIEWNAKQHGSTTLLSIKDNGPGITAEQVKTLFDDSVVNNEKNGFGLHLIRDLAKAIQYKIAVQSEPGKGTTFILSGIAT